jgi:hypothetical protein
MIHQLLPKVFEIKELLFLCYFDIVDLPRCSPFVVKNDLAQLLLSFLDYNWLKCTVSVDRNFKYNAWIYFLQFLLQHRLNVFKSCPLVLDVFDILTKRHRK